MYALDSPQAACIDWRTVRVRGRAVFFEWDAYLIKMLMAWVAAIMVAGFPVWLLVNAVTI